MRANLNRLIFVAFAFVALAIATVACASDAVTEQSAGVTIDPKATEQFSNLRPTGFGSFNERFYIGSLARDAIVPVYEPEFVSPAEIELWPNELVMGIEINGEAHAYPIGLMRAREMVNDVVGGVPVLVSW